MLEAVDMGADSCSHARSQLDRQIGWLRPLQRLGNHAGHMVIADLRVRPVTHYPAIASKFRNRVTAGRRRCSVKFASAW